MGDDEQFDDDGYDFRPPPSPDDRLWRHPAELALGAPAAPLAPISPIRHAQLRRNPWALGFVSVIGSALLAGSLMFAAGGLGDEPRNLGLAPVATLVDRTDPAGDTPGVVAVEVDTEHRARSGNGMVLADGRHVLTTWQLVRATDLDGARTALQVVDEHGTRHLATVVATDELSDLVVLRTDTDGLRPAAFATEADAVLGASDRLTLLGGGSGTHLRSWDVGVTGAATTTSAWGVVGVATLDRRLPSLAAGAVARDADGHFAGLASLDLGDPTARDHAAVIVPATRVRAVAAQFLAEGTISHGWLGVEANAVETTRNVSLRAGTTVAEVVPGSPAAGAGVQPGDVLLRVCGTDVGSIDDVLRVMLQTSPGTSCTIDALRNGTSWHTDAVVGRRAAA